MLLSIALVYTLISGVQSLLLLTILTVLLYITVCGTLLYFCRYKPAPEQDQC